MSDPGAGHGPVVPKPVRLLCHFIHRLLDFRLPEVESVAHMAGCKPGEVHLEPPFGGNIFSPLWYINLPSLEMAAKIASRCLLVRGFFEIWGEGGSWAELKASLRSCPEEVMAPFLGPEITLKVVFDSFGVGFNMEQQLQMIHELAFLPFKGKVDLKDPEHRFWLIVIDSSTNNGLPNQIPTRYFFCREVAVSDRNIVNTYALSKRSYIGPTSMDAELAFIMCNQAKVQRGHLVLDPYVGTGSVLVSAAHYGAFTMGWDIDVRVIRDGKVGKGGRHVDVYANFAQYNLQEPVGLVRMDVHRHALPDHVHEMFDAVLGDPPYGVRAGGRKSVARDTLVKYPATHIPSTDPYTLGECLRDLLSLAARVLKIGGRLVYWMPATPETFVEEEVPTHPALKLIYNSEQPLTTRYSRRLITMEKVAKYDADAETAHHQACGDPTMAIDRIHDFVYECIKDAQGRVIKEKLPKKQPYRGKVC